MIIIIINETQVTSDNVSLSVLSDKFLQKLTNANINNRDKTGSTNIDHWGFKFSVVFSYLLTYYNIL